MLKPGDTISISFSNTKLPPITAVVLEVVGSVVYVRYSDDAVVFAGLRGMVRLPRGKSGAASPTTPRKSAGA
jgi:hypothetical protein